MCHKTRDLGILVDSEINFKEHIYNITASANHRAFLIKKCFLSKDTSSLVVVNHFWFWWYVIQQPFTKIFTLLHTLSKEIFYILFDFRRDI